MKRLAILTVILAFVNGVHAQVGEGLFKSKCNTCHLVNKHSTGPWLKGVRQKWEDAGELENLYSWVKNPQNLIASGKSQLAMEVKEFSKTEMSPQDVTPEQVDAILAYVDNYQPPVETKVEALSPVNLTPNYKDNLWMFYASVFLTAILLLSIFMVNQSTSALMKTPSFLNALKKKAGDALGLILLVGVFGWSGQTYAMELNSGPDALIDQPWLLVEKTDLYMLFSLNIVLLGVLFYMKKMFNQLFFMAYPQKEDPTAIEEPTMGARFYQAMTDAVPIEEESKILLDHEYDGIQELDNNLPPWWLYGFYVCILFAIVYLFNYHVLGTGDLQEAAYQKDMAAKQEEVDAYLEAKAMNVDENSATLMTESADLKAGANVFQANCVSCHTENGGGNIGPNLTDKNWIYGYDVKDLFRTIKYGTANGMPEHIGKLNPIQTQQVASFILSLPEVQGKEAEGTIIEE